MKYIKYYKSNNLECLLPIYRKNNVGNITCRLNDIETTYSYLNQTNNHDLAVILSRLQENKYDYSNLLVSTVTKKYDRIAVYEENIPDNYIFTTWFYKGIYITNRTITNEKSILEEDHYDNNLSQLADKYYVIINTDNKPLDYNEAIIYNIKDGGAATVDLPELSINTYLNGSFKDKIYLTDIDNRKEYEIDATNDTIKEIGNTDIGYKVIEKGKKKKVTLDEIITNKYIFTNTVTNNLISAKYNPTEIKEYNGNYFYRNNNGDVYEIVGDKINNPILLFNIPNISTWMVKDDTIIIISGDTVYMYTNKYGLKPIIKDNELIYNYKNIIDFYKKS